jgi:hypothetical protein
LILEPRPSRIVWLWWYALHALLAAAALIVAAPPLAQAFAVAAVVGHGFVRRPRASPSRVVVSDDGACEVPEWSTGRLPLGARTLVCPFWVRLDLGAGPWRRDLLLVADQLEAPQWRRLRALLARVHAD